MLEDAVENLASTTCKYLVLPVLFLLDDVKQVWVDLFQGSIQLLRPLQRKDGSGTLAPWEAYSSSI